MDSGNIQEQIVRVGRIYIRISSGGTFVKIQSGIDMEKLKSILSQMKIPINQLLIESLLKYPGKWIKVAENPIHKDGHYSFQPSPDNLIGRMIYYPALVGRNLTEEEIYNSLIRKNGVKERFIVKDGIKKALSMPGTPQVIAHGIPPIHGRSATIRVVPINQKKYITTEKIDWKELGSLIFVKEGDIILEKEPPTPGKPGIDIFGREIPPIPGKDIDLTSLVCDNIKVSGNIAVAETSGILTTKDGKYCIEEVFVINGDLDYEIGNIRNVKHVEIKGSVLPGFSVQATGHIIVRGAVDGGYLTAVGNIFVEGIITGEKGGYLKAGGFIYGKEFIEAHADAGNNIYADGGFRHSDIMAGENIITLHPKAIAVGGTLIARKNIYIAQGGNIHGTKTTIHAGYVDDILADIESLTKEIEDLRQQIGKLMGELIKLAHITKKKEAISTLERELEKLKDNLNEKREKKKALEETVKKSSSFAIYVSKEAHQGTIFKLGRGYIYKPEDKIGPCVIRVIDGKLAPAEWHNPPFAIKRPKIKIK